MAIKIGFLIVDLLDFHYKMMGFPKHLENLIFVMIGWFKMMIVDSYEKESS